LFIVVYKMEHTTAYWLWILKQASEWGIGNELYINEIEVATAEDAQLKAGLLPLLAVVANTQLQIHIKAVFLFIQPAESENRAVEL